MEPQPIVYQVTSLLGISSSEAISSFLWYKTEETSAKKEMYTDVYILYITRCFWKGGENLNLIQETWLQYCGVIYFGCNVF